LFILVILFYFELLRRMERIKKKKILIPTSQKARRHSVFSCSLSYGKTFFVKDFILRSLYILAPMKWFDSLFSDKQSRTSLKEASRVEQNHSHKSYRDISKREPITLLSGLFESQKSYTPFSLRRNIEHFCRQIPHFMGRITRGHWSIIIIVTILAYCIYGI